MNIFSRYNFFLKFSFLLTAWCGNSCAEGLNTKVIIASNEKKLAQLQEDRNWLKKQEIINQQLRQNAVIPDFINESQLSLSTENINFIDDLTIKQQHNISKEQSEGVFYFVSFSIPKLALINMLQEAKQFAIPVTIRGMVDNNMTTTTQAVMELAKEGNTEGLQIDPQPFEKYNIQAVPALVVYCTNGYDVIRGNLHITESLKKIKESGDCSEKAIEILKRGVKND